MPRLNVGLVCIRTIGEYDRKTSMFTGIKEEAWQRRFL